MNFPRETSLAVSNFFNADFFFVFQFIRNFTEKTCQALFQSLKNNNNLLDSSFYEWRIVFQYMWYGVLSDENIRCKRVHSQQI